MSGDNYNPNSIDATLSRIETMLKDALITLEVHAKEIQKLKEEQTMTRIKLAGWGGVGAAILWIVDHIFFK